MEQSTTKIILIPVRYKVTVSDLHLSKRALNEAFDNLSFSSPEYRELLFDSYVQNLSSMILYAKEKRLNVYSYIQSIREELLKDECVRKR